MVNLDFDGDGRLIGIEEEALGPSTLAELIAATEALDEDEAIPLASEASARFDTDSATA
jgi:hypothetical protein